MPSSPQLASTRKGKKAANKKSARTPATITKQRRRSFVVESADEAEATAAPQLQADQDEQAAEAPLRRQIPWRTPSTPRIRPAVSLATR